MSDVNAADTLGLRGTYFDPLWRIRVELTPLERELLRSPWVRRLQFIAHAGAVSIATTQTYSRLEHSLGVFALTAHFTPHDEAARASALLHDVGHLALSHTFEGLRGMDHHALGHDRIMSMDGLLRRHGLTGPQLIAIDDEARHTGYRKPDEMLGIDHLDSFVRSGQANGRTITSPPLLLEKLRLTNGVVDTDVATARELIRLIVAEARAQRSSVNVVCSAVLRSFTQTLIEAHDDQTVATWTDHEYWSVLLNDPTVGDSAADFRRAPHEWKATQVAVDRAAQRPAASGISFSITKSYLALPTVNGAPPIDLRDVTALADSLPLHFEIHRSGATREPTS